MKFCSGTSTELAKNHQNLNYPLGHPLSKIISNSLCCKLLISNAIFWFDMLCWLQSVRSWKYMLEPISRIESKAKNWWYCFFPFSEEEMFPRLWIRNVRGEWGVVGSQETLGTSALPSILSNQSISIPFLCDIREHLHNTFTSYNYQPSWLVWFVLATKVIRQLILISSFALTNPLIAWIC